ncbi:hypothetical protein [Pseudomonas sp. 9AZ]|uniref:hypothetical protein n=1 Tax=Pseudomonas sp. 9AZ TaxID=2653168 RepID=UPI001358E27F|nr:hypothetical protein [Pseudomonas sp. 9AZ]
MTNRTEMIRSEIKILVAMGNGVGGTKVSTADHSAIREKILKALTISKIRSLHLANVDAAL